MNTEVTLAFGNDLHLTFKQELVKLADEMGDIVQTVESNSAQMTVFFRDHVNADERAWASRYFQEMHDSFARCEPKIAFETRHTATLDHNDPHEFLVEREFLRRVMPGVYAYKGLLCDLIESLDCYFVNKETAWHPQRYLVPAISPTSTEHRIGYFSNFPHLCMVGGPMAADRLALEGFSKSARYCSSEALNSVIDTQGIESKYILSPAACHAFYQIHQGSVVGSKPIVGTMRAAVFRWEGSDEISLTRLKQFAVRELVALGCTEQIEELQKEWLGLAEEILDELEIQGRIQVASDPFFQSVRAQITPFQMSQQTKLELVADLPYKSAPLAVGSLNMHGTHFSNAFAISSESGPATSVCLGLGLERWALAILAQHGTNSKDWPSALR